MFLGCYEPFFASGMELQGSLTHLPVLLLSLGDPSIFIHA